MAKWTKETLKIHFDERFLSMKEALGIATAAMDKRLDGMNEIRQQLNTQAGTMAGKEYVDAKVQMLEGKIESLQKLVYIGLGMILVLEVVLRFIKI